MFLQDIVQNAPFHSHLYTLSPNPPPTVQVSAPETGGDRGIDVYGLTLKTTKTYGHIKNGVTDKPSVCPDAALTHTHTHTHVLSLSQCFWSSSGDHGASPPPALLCFSLCYQSLATALLLCSAAHYSLQSAPVLGSCSIVARISSR